MAIFHLESSLESSGKGGGGSTGGGDEQVSFPSSVSSSYLEESYREMGLRSFVPTAEEVSGPHSPVYWGERVIHGISIQLLKGGVPIDDVPLEPEDKSLKSEMKFNPKANEKGANLLQLQTCLIPTQQHT
ncbi:hypothetical protein LR48_Vigan62s000200 [Vigna angularis]|uniref:Uncharacterized protein n=1 Tax=Phaseolus angularis TaxID=3914 RepID=A0A0L9T3P0_PHAAN|nr:hypothetical protein LR48_Vigan62s000200 [Vigna angularis]